MLQVTGKPKIKTYKTIKPESKLIAAKEKIQNHEKNLPDHSLL